MLGLRSSPAGHAAAALRDDEDFMMFTFKVVRCGNPQAHDVRRCPFAHPGETFTRRDPRTHAYSAARCPNTNGSREMTCPRGASCTFAHNAFELWCHPEKFRTEMCKYVLEQGTCNRPMCFFAHSVSELRSARPPSSSAAAAPHPSSRVEAEGDDGNPGAAGVLEATPAASTAAMNAAAAGSWSPGALLPAPYNRRSSGSTPAGPMMMSSGAMAAPAQSPVAMLLGDRGGGAAAHDTAAASGAGGVADLRQPRHSSWPLLPPADAASRSSPLPFGQAFSLPMAPAAMSGQPPAGLPVMPDGAASMAGGWPYAPQLLASAATQHPPASFAHAPAAVHINQQQPMSTNSSISGAGSSSMFYSMSNARLAAAAGDVSSSSHASSIAAVASTRIRLGELSVEDMLSLAGVLLAEVDAKRQSQQQRSTD